MSADPSSRREALRRGALAAGALAAGGLLRATPVVAQSPDDEDLRDFLVEAIGLEQVTVLAYSSASDAAKSNGDKQTYERFRDQEQAHANALRSAIDELGFDPPEAPDTPTDTGVFNDVEGLSDDAAKRLTDDLGRIADAKTPADFLKLLNELESQQLGLYVGRGPALDSPDLSTSSAEIAGCQGQHLVVLGQLDGKPPGQAAESVATAATKASQASSSQ